jgi:alpha-tubulin suppressor-like RCC1 family protein
MWAQPTLAVCFLLQLPVACNGEGNEAEASCQIGSRNCACYRDDSCEPGLRCRDELCVTAQAGESGGRSNAEGGARTGDAGEASSDGGVSSRGGAPASSAGAPSAGGASGGAMAMTGGAKAMGGENSAGVAGAAGAAGEGGVTSSGGEPGDNGEGGAPAIEPGALGDVLAVDAGQVTTCALHGSGRVSCWGSGNAGQLGFGLREQPAGPGYVSGIEDAVSLAVGLWHACAVLEDGSVRCWGNNEYGGLGDGTRETRATPVEVQGIDDAIAVVAGIFFTCVLHESRSVSCFGANDLGQLGDSDETGSYRTTPAPVLGLGSVARLSGGDFHTCALMQSDGSVKCWGEGQSGALGNAENQNRPDPVTVLGLSGMTGLASGRETSCAWGAEGSVSCWGSNSFGKLDAPGLAGNRSLVPVAASFSNALSIAIGDDHACGLSSDGVAACWGRNDSFQLGRETPSAATLPQTVAGIDDARSIGCGSNHCCVVLADHTVRCWGHNELGMLGDGTQLSSAEPVVVSVP